LFDRATVCFFFQVGKHVEQRNEGRGLKLKIGFIYIYVAGKRKITYSAQVTFWITFIAGKTRDLEFWG
jgi:hypothetical protein